MKYSNQFFKKIGLYATPVNLNFFFDLALLGIFIIIVTQRAITA